MQLPHVKFVDLFNDGLLYEVLVVKEIPNGDLFYIRTDNLDAIDKDRMLTILSKRDAARYALWDLLDQRVLPNGVNALEYFHQYVKGRTVSGVHYTPQPGRVGAQTLSRPPEQRKVAKKEEAAKTEDVAKASE